MDLLAPGRDGPTEDALTSPAAPVAREPGWQTEAVEWDPSDESENAAVIQGREALHALPTGRTVVIGKPLGSLLLPVGTERAHAFFESLPSA